VARERLMARVLPHRRVASWHDLLERAP
jgi:hypothetical protein